MPCWGTRTLSRTNFGAPDHYLYLGNRYSAFCRRHSSTRKGRCWLGITVRCVLLNLSLIVRTSLNSCENTCVERIRGKHGYRTLGDSLLWSRVSWSTAPLRSSFSLDQIRCCHPRPRSLDVSSRSWQSPSHSCNAMFGRITFSVTNRGQTFGQMFTI